MIEYLEEQEVTTVFSVAQRVEVDKVLHLYRRRPLRDQRVDIVFYKDETEVLLVTYVEGIGPH